MKLTWWILLRRKRSIIFIKIFNLKRGNERKTFELFFIGGSLPSRKWDVSDKKFLNYDFYEIVWGYFFLISEFNMRSTFKAKKTFFLIVEIRGKCSKIILLL